MDMPLRDMKIGIFGAGHLARALASRLVRVGITSDNLSLCHRGSPTTQRSLEQSGLAHLVREPAEIVDRSSMLLYAVRPQDYTAITPHNVAPEVLFVSFLAGIPLDRIPVALPQQQKVRVMPSTPDTIDRGNSIAAVYPTNRAEVLTMLKLIGARVVPLHRESDIHAFTVLGPCLPVALSLWASLGNSLEEHQVLEVGEQFGVADCASLIQWACQAQPCDLAAGERDEFFRRAATPGGVTEAIVAAIREGQSLGNALRRGIERSIELGDNDNIIHGTTVRKQQQSTHYPAFPPSSSALG